MNGIRTTIRDALDRARRLSSCFTRTSGRPLAVLGIAAGVLATALVPPSFARAADPPDSELRLQVVLKQVHIVHDRDWGEGEMSLSLSFYESDGERTHQTLPIVETTHTFSGSDGDDVVLSRLFPWEGDQMSSGVTRFAGIPVYGGRQYLFSASMTEGDFFTAEDLMGKIEFPVNTENGWGIGTHKVRGVKFDGTPADFELTFELRAAPLPDLRPVGIKVLELPGSTRELLCAGVVNSGIANPGPFEVTFRVNDNVPPGGKATAAQLVSGTGGDLCAEVDLPDAGQHRLSAYVDESRAVTEINETNNVYEQAYTAPLQAGSTSSQAGPTSGAAQPDLTVGAIKVNGRVPDGKDDCKDGKNRVAVVAKNPGTADAGSFALRLTVDGAQVAEQAVTGLEVAKEREVRFEDVRLKKGEHTLLAVAVPVNTIAETNEDNNELKVTVRCTDDD